MQSGYLGQLRLFSDNVELWWAACSPPPGPSLPQFISIALFSEYVPRLNLSPPSTSGDASWLERRRAHSPTVCAAFAAAFPTRCMDSEGRSGEDVSRTAFAGCRPHWKPNHALQLDYEVCGFHSL